MTEPLPADEFVKLLARTGVTLPPAEVEDLRLAHAKLQDMLALLREPPIPLAAEPAFTFKAGEGA